MTPDLPDLGASSWLLFLVAAPLWLALSYFFMVWDSRREGSSSRDDGQMGIKLVALFLVLIGVGMAAGGVTTLLHYLLSGASTGTGMLKAALASLLVGVAAVSAVLLFVLPRTNHRQHPKATRYAAGFLAATAGACALLAFKDMLTGLIAGAPWSATAGHAASTLTYGALAIFAISRLGGLSGWVMPPPRRPAYPPQGGMPPGAGYPPGYNQGGGYPLQGGGYPPPQGGGYPPPQGGGYPPPQGGGYPPPQGGGGYGPPR